METQKLAEPTPAWHRIKERNFEPHYFRDPMHCPEDGLGGAILWVTFRGENIGAVTSTWDFEHGVHWRAQLFDGRFLSLRGEGGGKVLATFGSFSEAVSALLERNGIAGGFESGRNLTH